MRNRVAPTGEIVDSPLRCGWLGNRGCIHGAPGEIRRPWATTRWITCRLEFKGRWHPQWAPGRYTALFLHDEAVAFAAGHRPCAECRRPDYDRFRIAWDRAGGGSRVPASEIDAVLHTQRFDGVSPRTHRRPWASLPVGAFVLDEAGPALVTPQVLVPWSADAADGYCGVAERPVAGDATVLTPSAIVEVLLAGYEPQLADVVGELLARRSRVHSPDRRVR